MNKFLFKLLISQFLLFAGEESGGGAGGEGGAGTPGFGGSTMGGSEGSQGSEGTPDPSPSNDNGSQIQYQYPENLDPSFHGSKSLTKFANPDGSFDYGKITQSYLQLEQHLGKDKMTVPGKEATPEQWRETFHKLGLPESVEGYEIKNSLPEGYEADESLFNGFKAKAHEMGILPNQAQGIIDFFNEFSVSSLQEMEAAKQSQIDESFKGLQKKWGESYNGRVERANDALAQFADKDMIAKLDESGLLKNSTFLEVFDKIAEGMSEDSFTPEGRGNFGMSSDDLDAEIAKTYEEMSKLGRHHPQYEAKAKNYQALLDKRFGDAPVR